MKMNLPEKLLRFADCTEQPLYLVGGAVRNHLAGLPASADFDLTGAFSAASAAASAVSAGFTVTAVYPRTGTVRLQDGDATLEFTSFREESYPAGGSHTPTDVCFTKNMEKDALRRDFTCNAVYYDVKNGDFCDPLGGISAIKERKLAAFAPDAVFRDDGLRLLRLARFAAELGFTPTEETLAAAKKYAANIDDISGERILDELQKILLSDQKYPSSRPDAPDFALRILHETTVLERIFPFVRAADGMPQRADFHDHDVLEHTLRAVRYAPPRFAVRLAALLHDAGKPTAMQKCGKMYGHEVYSEAIARQTLHRLRAGNALTDRVARLCRTHMFDLKGEAKIATVRRFLRENHDLFPDLPDLMQADFSACKDVLTTAPGVLRLRAAFQKMQEENVPLTLKDLAVSGGDLTALGFSGKETGEMLRYLFDLTLSDGKMNDKTRLLHIAAAKKPN